MFVSSDSIEVDCCLEILGLDTKRSSVILFLMLAVG